VGGIVPPANFNRREKMKIITLVSAFSDPPFNVFVNADNIVCWHRAEDDQYTEVNLIGEVISVEDNCMEVFKKIND
tara:strand:+ start:638 stop:865 length:228 start_codon:yes stop_codon:yes gene_type:complete